MFDMMSTRSKVLGGATILGVIATTVSVIKDKKDLDACIEFLSEDNEVVDPTADSNPGI